MTSALNLIEQFRNKGCAWQSQYKADQLLRKLKEVLDHGDFQALSIAHGHYLLGGGAEEVYDLCKALKSKYQ